MMTDEGVGRKYLLDSEFLETIRDDLVKLGVEFGHDMVPRLNESHILLRRDFLDIASHLYADSTTSNNHNVLSPLYALLISLEILYRIGLVLALHRSRGRELCTRSDSEEIVRDIGLASPRLVEGNMCGVNGVDFSSDDRVERRVRDGWFIEYGGEGNERFVFVCRNDGKSRL